MQFRTILWIKDIAITILQQLSHIHAIAHYYIKTDGHVIRYYIIKYNFEITTSTCTERRRKRSAFN